MGFKTGIDVIDRHGGLPSGLVFVVEEPGSGGKEFSYSVIMRNAEREPSILSIVNGDEEVIREISEVYPGNIDEMIGKIRIFSLAEEYFRDSIVPMRWVSERKPMLGDLKREGGFVKGLIEAFDNLTTNSLSLIDSINDIARVAGDKLSWKDVMDLFFGIRKVAIKKNALILAILTSDVLERKRENEILSSSDGIIEFFWEAERGEINRWMRVLKLHGILSHLERERIFRFQVRIDPLSGFTVTQYERVI